MDLLALGLLAAGAIFILIGIFIGNQKKTHYYSPNQNPQYFNNQPNHTAPSQNQNQPNTNVDTNLAPAAQIQDLNQAPASQMPVPEQSPSANAIATSQPEMPKVSVHVAKENPKLFEKAANLYLDYENKNVYTGEESTFKVQNVVGIRRFGKGVFSYDGFLFYFEHASGKEHFALNKLDHIAFYPNCIVLVSKNDLPSALIFVDETDTIRRILETFKVENV